MVWRQVYPLDERIYPHTGQGLPLAGLQPLRRSGLSGRLSHRVPYTKRPDGIVVHHQETCIGCTNCIRLLSLWRAALPTRPRSTPRNAASATNGWTPACLPACVQACPTGALTLVDLNTFHDDNAVQYPAGYPAMPRLNPSTRFILPRMPRLLRG